jgi:HEAT repeat protein
MHQSILDEQELWKLPPKQRLQRCEDILKNEKDESKRWDAVWVVGEMAEKRDNDDPIYNGVADLLVWVLQNDDNAVVKHEASFQIAARNMRSKIPDLIAHVETDPSGLAKHEAIEALGLMRAFEAEEMVKKHCTHPNPDVKQTAEFVLKRLERFKLSNKEYIPSGVI